MIVQKENISKLRDCYGCGVCVISCPQKIINLELNSEGFYSPIIHKPEKCIQCGICLDICAFNHHNIAITSKETNIQAYGGWSLNKDARAISTTGGIGYELAASCISKGIKVCAVQYLINEEKAQHYLAEDIEKLRSSQGTKYIPSDTVPGFVKINRKDKTIVFGLPCQIDSLRRYIRRFKIEDKIVLVDLFCYGVPSLLLWRNYLNSLKGKTGKIKKLKFRSKVYGWHQSACIELDGENGKVVQKAKQSSFYRLFFSNSCLNRCCSKSCKYKLLNSAADIRIGDFWGKKYCDNNEGVNAIITLTQKGETLIESLSGRCMIEKCSVNEALEGQKSKNAVKSPFRPIVVYGLQHKWSLDFLNNLVKFGRVIINPHSILKSVLTKVRNGK